jgi:MFS transporter, NNP family, nitrate/nitrite transporter
MAVAGSSGRATPVVTLVVATVGLGLNQRAWILLGPRLADRPDVTLGEYVALMSLPVLVAALLRVPVGVLTDRYGARVMFPVVCLAAAVPVVALGLTDAKAGIVVAGTAAGVAGTAFGVGAAVVARTFGYGRRGLALGVFSLSAVLAVAISVASRFADPGGRTAALVLGAGLVGFAALAAALLRDPVVGHPAGSPLARCVEMARLAAGTSLSLLYALALGGVVAIGVYLPAYLTAVLHLTWWRALTITAPIVVVASAARLAGGWWTDRRPTARLLIGCYGIVAGLYLALSLAPRLWWLTAVLVGAVAVCDGLASGTLLALIGKAARPESAGAVMGVIGAAAALGAVALSLLLVGLDRISGSYTAGWLLLAVVMSAVTLYVRAYGLRIGLGLAVRPPAVPSPTAMTVAVVGEAETRWGAAAVVAQLADLATSDELVVVYGSDAPARPRSDANVLVAGLRDRLPRHRVIALRVGSEPGALSRNAALFGEFVESGAVAVAVTPAVESRGVAAQLSSYLRADRVLAVSYSPAAGADLHKVWDRTRD